MKKNKKTIGIICISVLLLIGTFFIYISGGKNELENNNSEEIWVEQDTKGINGNNEEQRKEIVVEIKGEVNKPDIYWLDENSIIDDLLSKAGGIKDEADISNINRAEKLRNHQSIYIPNKSEVETTNIQSTGANKSSGISNDGIVNVNVATLEELDSLPGIGVARAGDIIKYREENGGFKTIEEMKNVKGIGDASYEKLKEKITV